MQNKGGDLSEKARNYAFLLLKFRVRSEDELRRRLEKKKFPAEIISKTLDFLREKRFLDDDYFARAWIEWRIKKPLGLRRISEELRLKGIDREVINKKIAEIKEQYREEETVLKLAQEKIKKLKGIDPTKTKARLYAYLMRRGFSPETVMEAVNRLCKQTY